MTTRNGFPPGSGWSSSGSPGSRSAWPSVCARSHNGRNVRWEGRPDEQDRPARDRGRMRRRPGRVVVGMVAGGAATRRSSRPARRGHAHPVDGAGLQAGHGRRGAAHRRAPAHGRRAAALGQRVSSAGPRSDTSRPPRGRRCSGAGPPRSIWCSGCRCRSGSRSAWCSTAISSPVTPGRPPRASPSPSSCCSRSRSRCSRGGHHRRGGRWAAGVLAGHAAAADLTGHSSSSPNHGLATTSVAFHLLFLALVVGGLGLLCYHALRGHDRLSLAAEHFSRMAFWCFVGVGLSGLGVLRRGPDHLDHGAVQPPRTGSSLLLKIVAYFVLGGIGWWHCKRTLPDLPPGGRWRS